MIELPIKRVSGAVKMPSKAHLGDAGIDLVASKKSLLAIGLPTSISTGIQIAIPENYCGLILPRSSMGRRGIIIPNSPGLIDSGYRGDIQVLLLNLGRETYSVSIGDRIAQLVIMKYEDVKIMEVSSLPESFDGRGDGGFGSSGK